MPASVTRLSARSALLVGLALLLLVGLLPPTARAQTPVGAVDIGLSGGDAAVAEAPSPIGVTVRVTNRGALGDHTPLRLEGTLGAVAEGAEVALVRPGAEPDVLDLDDEGRFVFPREDRAPLTIAGDPALVGAQGMSLTLLLTMPDTAPTDLSVGLVQSNEQSAGILRRAGAERAATAATVSARTFNPGAPVAFIARADDFPDALAAGPVAGAVTSPILLTFGSALPAATTAELERLQPQRIVVLGGPAAVGDAVVEALAEHTTGTVSRLEGPNRFATAAAVARSRHAEPVETVLIATGETFADALSGGPAAAAAAAPILLVTRSSIPAETAEALTELAPQEIVILGGTAAVGDDVAAQLGTFAAEGVRRIAGATRFETSAAISAETATSSPGGLTYLATGQNFPDSLAGAPAAIADGASLLLVTRDGVPAAVGDELERLQPGVVVLLGGEGVVSRSVVDGVAQRTRTVEPERGLFAGVGARASTPIRPLPPGTVPGGSNGPLRIEPIAPQGTAALRPGDRFVLRFTAPRNASYVVEHGSDDIDTWTPFLNKSASGVVGFGQTQVALNAPTELGAHDVRVRLSGSTGDQIAVLADAMTVALRFRPPLFSSLVTDVDDQTQFIAVSPIRGLAEGVQLDADLSEGVRAGIDYRDARLTLLHGTGEARIVRNRPPDFAQGRQGCALCIEYIAGPGDGYTEGETPRPAPIIAVRLDGVDVPAIDGTFVGRFFRYDDMHGVQWPFSVGAPGAVASPTLSNLQSDNEHQSQQLSFSIPGAPGQQALAPGAAVVVDLSAAQRGAVDYSKAFAFVSGGGGHDAVAPSPASPHEPPPPALGDAVIEVDGDAATLTFTAGPEGVPALSPEGPIVQIFIAGVEVGDATARYPVTVTRSDIPAVSRTSFAVGRGALTGVRASNLARSRANQTQTFSATLDGPAEIGEVIVIDLTGAQIGGVDYADVTVTVTGGSGGAQLVTFDDKFEGGGAALFYSSGGDADRTRLTFRVTGVATSPVDESHFASFFRTHGENDARAVFDVGVGSPFVSPIVTDVESATDDGYQGIQIGVRSRLAPGQTIRIDLSSAERGDVSYGGAFAEAFDELGTAALAVVDGTSAVVTYTAGSGGVPAGSAIFIELGGVVTGSGAAEHTAILSRTGDARTATVPFSVRQVPSLGDVSASNLASGAIGLTQTFQATIVQDMQPGEIVQIDLSGAEVGAAAYGGAQLSVAGGTGTANLEAFRGGFASITYRSGPLGDPDGTGLVFTLRGVNTDAANETHAADFFRYSSFKGEGVSQQFFFNARSARFTIGSGGPFIGPPSISAIFGGASDDFQFVDFRLTDALAAGQQVVIDLSEAQAGVVDYRNARVEFASGNGTAVLSTTATTARLTFTAGPGGVRSGRRIGIELGGISSEPAETRYTVRFTAPGGTATADLQVFGGHGCCFEGFASAGGGGETPSGSRRASRLPR